MSDHATLDFPAKSASDTALAAAEPTRCLVGPLAGPAQESANDSSGAYVSCEPIILADAVPPLRTIPQSNDPWIGRTLKDYVIEGFLGAGGMGRVYRARHRWLEMQVAIKFLKEDLLSDEQGIARFRRESLAVARLNHPNIVRATDGGVEGNVFFLVTEFVPGSSISKVLEDHILSVPDVCEIVCQAAAALQHAHEHGMVHRDIKPSNLMLSLTGQVKLLDLGLARFAQGNCTLTETGHVMGSLDFMAPEQAGDSRNVDIRADIYSLGCTLYCLLTGVPPFHGPAFDTPVSKLVAHSDTEPPAVTLRRPKVPKGVLACLTKMMAKDRNARQGSPAEVIAALKPFVAGANLTALMQPDKSQLPAPRNYTDYQAEPQPDWVDHVYDSLLLVLKTLLCLIGVLERNTLPASPLSVNRPKTTYQVSAKGLANVIVLAAVAGFLYLSGLRIYFW